MNGVCIAINTPIESYLGAGIIVDSARLIRCHDGTDQGRKKVNPRVNPIMISPLGL
jgi:hypothetical protein